MVNEAYRLNDDAMKRFIMNGYVTVKTDFPASFHERVYEKTQAMFEKVGNPSNNLLPRIPELQQVFDHPAVHGALASILGGDYYLHPHRHCHINTPGSDDQGMHKDSLHNSRFAVDGDHRHHRTRWAMAFYYPQDTPVELGPTAIWSQSQYVNTQPPFGDDEEVALAGEAGTVAIVHYDVFHRKMRNSGEKTRYMMKFLFTRMSEPQSPSWDSRDATWMPTDDVQERTWEHLWEWYLGTGGNGNGKNGASKNAVSELADELGDESELVGIDAAYQLGQVGEYAIPALMDALKGEDEAVCRNAGYGLNAIGQAAVPALVDATRDADERIQMRGVDALGDMGLSAQEAVPALIERLKDESEHVRSHAAEALGTTAQLSDSAVTPLVSTLQDEKDLVRRNTALSLARIGPHAPAAVPVLAHALHDENHFVRAFSLHALRRINTPESTEVMLNYLQSVRWCPSH